MFDELIFLHLGSSVNKIENKVKFNEPELCVEFENYFVIYDRFILSTISIFNENQNTSENKEYLKYSRLK